LPNGKRFSSAKVDWRNFYSMICIFAAWLTRPETEATGKLAIWKRFSTGERWSVLAGESPISTRRAGQIADAIVDKVNNFKDIEA
jgi:hypothetical protein